jgi:putative transposase
LRRSAFYFTPKGESPETLALMRRIDEVFLRYPFYGSRQMVLHLGREGIAVGRHRVRRLMRLMGLEAICRAPKTSTPHPAHRIYPYLLHNVTVDRADHVWCADITYVQVQRGVPLPDCDHGLGATFWRGGCRTRWTHASASTR